MKKIESFEILVMTFQANNHEEWIYTNLEQWNSAPESSTFYMISDEEVDELPDEDVYESSSGAFLPKILEDEDLYPWLLTSALEGILLHLHDGKNAPLEEVRAAIEHYRENDTFLEQ